MTVAGRAALLVAVVVLAVVTTIVLEVLAGYVVARNALRSRTPGPLEAPARRDPEPLPECWT